MILLIINWYHKLLYITYAESKRRIFELWHVIMQQKDTLYIYWEKIKKISTFKLLKDFFLYKNC